jgi:tRNA dimethylallyltransferase
VNDAVSERPPVALVGTTASGKSQIALRAAVSDPIVEILSADSMGVYRGMDIGTAKPSAEDRRSVRHHLLDLVDPSDEFTVAQFQRAVRLCCEDIANRGAQPLLVGGTGLYVRAAIDELELPGRWPDIAAALDARAEQEGGLEVLYAELVRADPIAASRIEANNRRRIVRALEVTSGSGRPFSSFGPGLGAYPRTPWRIVGLRFDAAAVDRRIEGRFTEWLEVGFLDEVRHLAEAPTPMGRTARQAVGYRELLSHIEEGTALEEAVEVAIRRTKTLARRQWAWFRRDPRIRWIEPDEDPVAVLWSVLCSTAVSGARE